jgi:enoyl-CoA hydratase
VSEPTAHGDIHVKLRDDRVGVVTFNRPEKLNALTGQSFARLEQALRRLGERRDCGAIVIAGAGRAFSAGMDLATQLGIDENDEEDRLQAAYGVLRLGVAAIIALREIPQPVIVAVHGHAVGGAFSIAAAADIRICAPDTQFSAPFLRIGMTVGDLGLSWLLPRLIGPGSASEIFYTSATINAADARRLGLVQRVVDDPISEAVGLAADLAARPPLAVKMSKELLNSSIGAGGLREHLELEMRSQVIGLLTPEHREAARNFVKQTESATFSNSST